MTTQTWYPITDVGDVIVHHVAPKVWLPCAVTTQGDLNGRPTTPCTSRARAMAVAQGLLVPGRKIYVRHHDDAEWEAVS